MNSILVEAIVFPFVSVLVAWIVSFLRRDMKYIEDTRKQVEEFRSQANPDKDLEDCVRRLAGHSESHPSTKCAYCGCTNDHIYGTCDYCGAPLEG